MKTKINKTGIYTTITRTATTHDDEVALINRYNAPHDTVALCNHLMAQAVAKCVKKGLFKRVKKLPADPRNGIGFEEGGRYYLHLSVKAEHMKNMLYDFHRLRQRIGGILRADKQGRLRDMFDATFHEAVWIGLLVDRLDVWPFEPAAKYGKPYLKRMADARRKEKENRKERADLRYRVIAEMFRDFRKRNLTNAAANQTRNGWHCPSFHEACDRLGIPKDSEECKTRAKMKQPSLATIWNAIQKYPSAPSTKHSND